MTLTDEQMGQIYDKLTDMTTKQLSQVIYDRVLPYLTNIELIDIIEQYFIDEDWEWFYNEYIEEEKQV